MPTRRDFLLTMGAALGASTLGAASASALDAENHRKLPKVGIQLYTLRDLLAKDFEGTLAKVAEIGYREVEFAGYYDRTPTQIKDILKSNKLSSPSSHLGFPKTDDAWKKSLDEARTVGHKWAVIAWIDPAMRKTADDWHRFADRFNEFGRMAKASGLRFAYHNHDFELTTRVENGTALDYLLSKTDPKLVDFEMDIYWVVKGGGDPLDFIKRHPRRFPLMHVKDATAAPERTMVDVGAGTIDFGKIFAKDKKSGMKHAFVEHDQPKDPLASAAASYKHLASLKY